MEHVTKHELSTLTFCKKSAREIKQIYPEAFGYKIQSEFGKKVVIIYDIDNTLMGRVEMDRQKGKRVLCFYKDPHSFILHRKNKNITIKKN